MLRRLSRPGTERLRTSSPLSTCRRHAGSSVSEMPTHTDFIWPPRRLPRPRPCAETDAISVVLADDHALMRRSLRLVLDGEATIEVVAEADDLATVERHVHGDQPRVLVLDLGMPDGSGLPAIGNLRRAAPETQIVVITMEDNPGFAQRALAAGASGFVLKDHAEEELADSCPRRREGRNLRDAAGCRRDSTHCAAHSPTNTQPPRGRGPAADRLRPHQRRNRADAEALTPHGRDAPRPHPPEARSADPSGTGPLRASSRPSVRLRRFRGGCSARVAESVVPCSPDSIVERPPARVTRSRMPASPNPSVASAVSKPCPSSATSIEMRPSVALDRDPNRAGVGMLGDIRQRLLDQPVDGRLEIEIKAGDSSVDRGRRRPRRSARSVHGGGRAAHRSRSPGRARPVRPAAAR